MPELAACLLTARFLFSTKAFCARCWRALCSRRPAVLKLAALRKLTQCVPRASLVALKLLVTPPGIAQVGFTFVNFCKSTTSITLNSHAVSHVLVLFPPIALLLTLQFTTFNDSSSLLLVNSPCLSHLFAKEQSYVGLLL